MIHLVEAARDLSRIDQTVLIEGETGTGKELIARLIHDAGPREAHPFVAINCAALPQHLLESELFGHKKGSFTGAERDRAGHLVAAGRGTVFLDEVDKASREFQARLLRVLEDRAAVPLGSSDPRPIHARIVCAANRDLQGQADRGEFLPDLYYRLAGIRLAIPPLRDRPEDLEVLVDYFLDNFAGKLRHGGYRLTREAREALHVYEWPGNVRELRNVLEGAAFFARGDGVILREHLGRDVLSALTSDTLRGLPKKIEELEREEISAALARTGGNKAQAARLLGVTRKGLGDRIRRLGLDEG
jgi:transcriptional regulator with PAS, ATPase and Fis domain